MERDPARSLRHSLEGIAILNCIQTPSRRNHASYINFTPPSLSSNFESLSSPPSPAPSFSSRASSAFAHEMYELVPRFFMSSPHVLPRLPSARPLVHACPLTEWRQIRLTDIRAVRTCGVAVDGHGTPRRPVDIT